MSIASEIQRISGNISDAYTAANAKGATMPVSQNSDNLATTISTIQTGTTPTGTKSITSNGVYDVTDFASADVQVPTTAPDYYVGFSRTNAVINKTSFNIDFTEPDSYIGAGCLAYIAWQNTNITSVDLSGVTQVAQYGLSYAFRECTSLTSVDLSNLTFVDSNGCSYAFFGCTALSGTVDLSSLTIVNGDYGCQYMFSGCTGITSVDLSSLEKSIYYGCQYMFSGCTSLTSVDLSKFGYARRNQECQAMFTGCTSLTSVLCNLYRTEGSYAICGMFSGCTSLTTNPLTELLFVYSGDCIDSLFSNCTGLTSVGFPKLLRIGNADNEYYAAQNLFSGCSNLTDVTFSSLVTISGQYTFNNAFKNCTSLTSISFPNLLNIETSQKNQFGTNMLSGCDGVTIHFPSNLTQDLITSQTGYPNFGGTNTTVLFDLPAVTKINLSAVTSLANKPTALYNLFNNNTKTVYNLPLDLSNLTSASGQNVMASAFSKTKITSVDMSSVKEINGCSNCFSYCAELTSFDMSSLEDVSIGNCFISCTSLTSASFPSARKISNMTYCFTGCTSLASVNFDMVEEVESGSSVMYQAFSNSQLSSISFPSLRTVGNSAFREMLTNCSNVTVHFPSNFTYNASVHGVIGGTNTTIVSDLPSAFILTGVDTKTYKRNPAHDTASALAWFDTSLTPSTAFYTSGTTDPQVSDTIYSDSTCTIAATTIDSIA